MQKIIILLCLLVLIVPVWGIDLDQKRKELEAIEKQIERNRNNAANAAKKKEKTQKDLSLVEKQKKQVDQKIQQLHKVEVVAEDSLLNAMSRLQKTENRLSDMNRICNDEFLRLFYLHYQDKYTSLKASDKRLLSMLISSTLQKIKHTQNQRELFESQKEQNSLAYLRIHSTKMNEARKSQQYVSKMRNMQKQVKQLSKEEQKYLALVDKLQKDRRELESLLARLNNATPSEQPKSYKFTGALPMPVRGKVIRFFGEEHSELYNTTIINNGIDIACPEGSSVISIDDGEVVFADRFGGQGKLVIVDHKNGFFSLYSYNSSIAVSKGQQVKKGQRIASSGKSGSAREPSLHFELRKNGKPVNPMAFLRN